MYPQGTVIKVRCSLGKTGTRNSNNPRGDWGLGFWVTKANLGLRIRLQELRRIFSFFGMWILRFADYRQV